MFIFTTNLHLFIIIYFFIFLVWKILYHIPLHPSCQLDILWHDVNTLAVDGTQICILKQVDNVPLHCLFHGKKGHCLKSQITPYLLGDLPNPPHKWKPPDKEEGRLLKFADLPQGHCTWPASFLFSLGLVVPHHISFSPSLLSSLSSAPPALFTTSPSSCHGYHSSLSGK